MLRSLLLFSTGIVLLSLMACTKQDSAEFKINYEKYVLDNGLEVILHKDTSDPIVAVTTLVHVGSNREKPGRTGFAHFFEHMSFNDSENVPRGANRKMIPELGGSRNGGTWSDGTIYYEVVPKDAFEKIMWIDSDRLGFMINTVTKEALEREKQVVKNEKRERVDNSPYGHTGAIIRKNLYPADHPYNWTVIGELKDLQAATLQDVKEFYNQYYGANNATLVIAGDIDIAETKKLVEKWFGEIRRGPQVEPMTPVPVMVPETKSLYYEDNFAKLPELRMVFPAVESYHADSYALQVLAEILSGSKSAPLYQVIVEEKKWAPSVSASSDANELAGEFIIRVRANAGVDLDSVKSAVETGLSRFEQKGFEDVELTRIKAKIETDLYNSVETVLDKTFQLAIYNEFAGDPGYISKEARLTQQVTREDVIHVYEKYIKGKNFVMTSFVPKGQAELAVTGAEEAVVYEEKIVADAANEEVSQGEEAQYEKTVTQHDRSEPPLGEAPLFKSPQVWQEQLANDTRVYGITTSEVPLVSFDVTLKGGHWLDPIEKPGVANLLSDLMMEGTQNKTPIELEQAIGLLGANVSFSAGNEEMIISVNTLARNFEKTLSLIEEIMFEPRWDEKEFDRLKREQITRLKGLEASPTSIASRVQQRLLYGSGHILGQPSSGTIESVEVITMDDLKDFYNTNFAANLASVHIVGDIEKERALKAIQDFGKNWPATQAGFPEYSINPEGQPGHLYFIDVPGAKQSVLRLGRLIMSAADDDYSNLEFADQIMGGGSSGRLFQLLRIEKGYTYGAYSYMGNTIEQTPYIAYSSVRSNVTRESLDLIRDLYRNYKSTFNDEEMKVTKNKIIKDNTRKFESLNAKLGLLRNISKLGYDNNYAEKDQQELLTMTLKDFHNLIENYLDEEQMFYLVVGDKATQLKRLSDFNKSKPVQLDIKGDLL
ncbi:MAG: insulinase family protein [Calditrichaeota bacterium]|nr:insulinase family protein [Calditrichota bacterium]